jgi:hypothetical protein
MFEMSYRGVRDDKHAYVAAKPFVIMIARENKKRQAVVLNYSSTILCFDARIGLEVPNGLDGCEGRLIKAKPWYFIEQVHQPGLQPN